MKNMLKQELAQRVLPGYGFFGAPEYLRLTLPVNQKIDCIKLGVQAGSTAFLSLNGVELFAEDGSKVDLESVAASATLSSVYEEKNTVDALPALVKGRPIHTGLEHQPTLEMQLTEPVFVSQIRIANREGYWGHRAVHLVADVWCGDEQVVHYKNRYAKGLIDQFDYMVGKLVTDVSIECDDRKQLPVLAQTLSDAFVNELCTDRYSASLSELTSLLPMYTEYPDVSENTLIIFGELISSILLILPVFPTRQLSDFEKILRTRERMTKVIEYASVAVSRKTNVHRDLVLAKHKIGIVNLLPSKNAYLDSMRALEDQMRQWKIPLMLCYGTLLGAVRNGQFIAHDDDVDLLYVDGSNSHEDMMKNRKLFIERLKASGHSIVDSGVNFQVKPPECKVYIDVFPSWSAQGQTHLMVERRKFRGVSTDVLLPLGQVELYGEMFPAPNNSKALLEHRYGADWQVSDPFYEWPWLLTSSTEPTCSNSRKAA